MRKASFKKRISRAVDVFRGRRTAYSPNELLQAALVASRVNRQLLNSSSYDAGKVGRTRSDWGTSTNVPYWELVDSHKKMRARSRELFKNDGTYRRAIKSIIDHTIGTGLRPRPRVVDSNKKPIKGINKQLEDVAERYLYSKAWDATEGMCFVGEGQRLGMQTQLTDGDVLLNRTKAVSGNYLGVAWQMAQIDRLDDSRDEFYRNFEFTEPIKQTVHGIMISANGAPRGYWFKGLDKPVYYPNIVHSYLRDRPEQYLGECLGVAILDTVYDKHDLSEDYLIKSRAVAKVLHWLSTLSDFPNAGDQDEDGFTELANMSVMRSEHKPEHIRMPDDVSKTVEPLLRMTKHDISSSMGISYISTLLDMTQVNFAAASMNSIKEWITFMPLRNTFVSTFCQPVWEKTVAQAVIEGRVRGLSYEAFLSDPFKYTRCQWIADAREYADPYKTAKAAVENINSKRVSLIEDVQSRGKDWEDHVEELKKQKEDLEAAGLAVEDVIDLEDIDDEAASNGDEDDE